MQIEPLWKEMYEKYYDVSYQELLVDRLVSRWVHTDITFRFLIAITASGSAISSWAVWSHPEVKIIWSVISSIAALSAIIYGIIPINRLIKEGNISHSKFNQLRIKFDKLIMSFKMDEGENLEKHAKDLGKLTDEAVDLWQKTPRFPLIGERLKKNTQADLNLILVSKGLIEGDSDYES